MVKFPVVTTADEMAPYLKQGCGVGLDVSALSIVEAARELSKAHEIVVAFEAMGIRRCQSGHVLWCATDPDDMAKALEFDKMIVLHQPQFFDPNQIRIRVHKNRMVPNESESK